MGLFVTTVLRLCHTLAVSILWWTLSLAILQYQDMIIPETIAVKGPTKSMDALIISAVERVADFTMPFFMKSSMNSIIKSGILE
jgi:hypothetical protein